jgi:hypothetical protein
MRAGDRRLRAVAAAQARRDYGLRPSRRLPYQRNPWVAASGEGVGS